VLLRNHTHQAVEAVPIAAQEAAEAVVVAPLEEVLEAVVVALLGEVQEAALLEEVLVEEVLVEEVLVEEVLVAPLEEDLLRPLRLTFLVRRPRNLWQLCSALRRWPAWLLRLLPFRGERLLPRLNTHSKEL